jgi:hypothetical protein
VAAALSAYASELEAARAQALRLESEAVEARQAHQMAFARVHDLSGPAPGETDSSARLSQLSTANQRVDELGGDYQAILSRAQALQDHMESVASATAARIQAAAASPPYREPGTLQQAWDHVTSFVREHAAAIRQISSVLKIVSAVAGLLALIPVVGEFLAPVALIAAGAAIGLDILLKLSTGEGSWTEIGLMAALTFVPGGKLLRVGGDAVRPSEFSGPWVYEATNIERGGAVVQSRPGSCVSACGEMLTGGAVKESRFLELLGEYSHPEALEQALIRITGDNRWLGKYFMHEAAATAAAHRGPMAAVLQAPGGGRHMVVIEPAEGGQFLVRDPLPGVTYQVAQEWIEKFVSGGVYT